VDEDWDDDTDPDDPGNSSYTSEKATVNSDEVERLIHEKINERRARHDLPPMENSLYITSVSRAHSEDMADRDYFAHENPDGEDFIDRFEKFPEECADGYGENIAANYLDTRVRNDQGETDTYYTAEDVSTALVQQWMNSTGHRENILTEKFEYVGTGIYIQDRGDKAQVYATQNFCAIRD
jgi:uncharacterized protein YkwD